MFEVILFEFFKYCNNWLMMLLEGGGKLVIYWESEGEDKQVDLKLKVKWVKYLLIKDELVGVRGV